MGDLETAPTRDELEIAYRRLFDAKVSVICDLSLGAIADIVGGSPPHAPTRWSPAEIRLARAVLILRAACLPSELTQESIDPGNPVLQAADAFNRSQLAPGDECLCGHLRGRHYEDAGGSGCAPDGEECACDEFRARGKNAVLDRLCRCGHRYGMHIDAQPSLCEHTTGDKLDPFCHCEGFAPA